MNNFHAVLYEAVLVAFGKILAKYDAFTQGVIMKDIGREVIAYLDDHGFGFEETDSVEDLGALINLFVENGFADSLEITPADQGDNYVWTNLYGMEAYKELYDLALNPFLACPLNLCMCYVAGKHNKKLKMHRKEFVNESITEAQYELVDDTDQKGNLDELILKSARMFEIADKKQRLFHHQAITDPLTGMHNLRHIQETGQKLFEQAKLKQDPIAIFMFDIDYFKTVNDSFGHSSGDAVLRKLAEVCKQSVRGSDLLARYGGEEFVMILPNTTPLRAVEIAERLRESVETTDFETDDGKIVKITISIGICSNNALSGTFETALKRADRALFRAKNDGRNQIYVCEDDMKM